MLTEDKKQTGRMHEGIWVLQVQCRMCQLDSHIIRCLPYHWAVRHFGSVELAGNKWPIAGTTFTFTLLKGRLAPTVRPRTAELTPFALTFAKSTRIHISFIPIRWVWASSRGSVDVSRSPFNFHSTSPFQLCPSNYYFPSFILSCPEHFKIFHSNNQKITDLKFTFSISTQLERS